MKICPSCQESNHDAAVRCMLCGTTLPDLPVQAGAVPGGEAEDPDVMLVAPGPAEPPPGTLAIAVYHDEQPRVVHYHEVSSDLTLIGREDAGRGVFPDLDLARLVEEGVSAECVSRSHATLIRRPDGLQLEVMAGSTGTQLKRELCPPGATVSVRPGDRIVLGSRVRLKLVQF